MKRVMPFVSTYIKDSKEFLEKSKEATRDLEDEDGLLPRNLRLITADAISMYTNIDTAHGLEVLRQFLTESEAEDKLPHDFNTDVVLHAATLVMEWNIMEFGERFSNN